MRRSIQWLIMIGIVVLGIVMPARAAAYPPCGDLQSPGDPYSFCRPLFGGHETVRLRDNVSFGWLHTSPHVHAPITNTVLPSNYASMIIWGSGSYWDGYQWWWHVTLYPEDIHVRGWIEQAALVYAVSPPDQSGPYDYRAWQTPVAGQIEPGIPFVWLRSQPASTGEIITTIPPNGAITILGPNSFDGTQIWWRVQAGDLIGYVEQSLIIALP